jgi:hypothetical protein
MSPYDIENFERDVDINQGGRATAKLELLKSWPPRKNPSCSSAGFRHD